MSASLTVQIADEVTALLNGATGGTFTPSFTAVRRYAPYLELTGLTSVKVSVVPGDREQTFANRKFIDADHEVRIYVQKLLTKAEDPAEIDPLTLLIESIGNYLAADSDGVSRRRLPTNRADLMKLAGPTIFTKELVEMQQFSAMLVATYSTSRAFR
jgi:hypothetical protein